MTILPFPTFPERHYSRDQMGCVVVREQDRAGVASKHPSPVRTIIVGALRLKFETPLQTSQAGNSEGGANRNAASLPFIDTGACADLSNLCRSLTGWSLPRVQLRQKSLRGIFQAFQSFRCWLLPHGNNHGRRSFVSVQKDFGEVRNV